MKHQNNLLWQLSLVTLVILLLFCTVSTIPAQTVPEIAEKALAATVYLEMQDSNGKPLGFGSGFFVTPNLIATNYHVIAGAASGTAKLVGKSTIYKIEGFTATNKYNDLALLKVSASGINPLPIGNSDAVKIGETVYVAGNPKGLEGTFSDGIISSRHGGHAKGRLQMTAPISPGSSGSPMLNRKGEVIGVSFMILEGGQNLNFAIPSLYVKTLLALSGTVKPLSQGNHSISAETYFARGNTKAALGQYVAATSDYDKAIQLKPDDADAYYNRGVVKHKLGQHSAAISDYDKAIQLKPGFAEAYINRGNTKANLGQYYAAISDFDKAIQLEPDAADAYYNRGLAKDYLGQHIVAINDFNKVIQLEPDHTDAYYNRGVVKADLGQYYAAISDYDKVIQLEPDAADAYYNRGLAKYRIRQYPAAVSNYDKVIQLKPNHAGAYLSRGVAKVLLNRKWEAKQDFQIALRLAEKAGDDDIIVKSRNKLTFWRVAAPPHPRWRGL